MSCCDVNDLNRPLAQCAIGLRAHPHPAVADASLGLCQLMRNALDIVSRNTGQGSRPVGAQPTDRGRHLIQPVGKGAQRAGCDQIFAKQHMNNRQQKRCIRARPDKQVLARHVRGLGATRINNDQLSAPAFQISQSLAHIGHCPDTAIGRQRVGAQHQKVMSAVHVGDRMEEHVAKTPQRHQVMRQLVNRRSRETIARPDMPKQVPLVGQHAVVMNRGITKVGADGINSLLFDCRGQCIRS